MRFISYFIPVPLPVDIFITSFIFILLLLKIFSILLPFFRPNKKFQVALALLVATFNVVWMYVKDWIVMCLYPLIAIWIPVPIMDAFLLCIEMAIMYYLIVKLVL